MRSRRLFVAVAAAGLLAAGCAIPETPPPVSAPAVAATVPPGTATPTATPPSAHTVARPGLGGGALLADETVELAAGAGPVVLSFDAAPLQAVRVQITPDRAAGLAYTVQVVDRFGNVLARAEDASIPELVLPFQGPYRVEVEAQDGGGPCRISVLAVAAEGPRALAGPGDRAEAALPAGAAAHAYLIPLTAGDVVTLRAAGLGGNAGPSLTLFGPDGQALELADGAALVAAHSGTYAALVASPDGSPSEYEFEVVEGVALPEPAGEADVAPGRIYRATLVDGNPLVLTLDGHRGDALSAALHPAAPGLDADLHLFSPYGAVLAHGLRRPAGEPEHIDEVQLPYDGRYTLRVTPRGSGEATLTLTALGAAAITGGGELGDAGGGARLARFDAPGAFHVYTFDARAGSSFSASITPAGAEPPPGVGLSLLGPDGLPLAAAGGGTGQALVPAAIRGLTLPASGEYVLVAYPLADGERGYYRLRWEIAE